MSSESTPGAQSVAGAEADELRARVRVLEAEIVKARAKAQEATQRARRASYEASMAQMQASSAEQDLRNVLASTSWRITAPMRSAVRVMRSARSFARDPSWSALKRKAVTLVRDVAGQSTLARKVAFYVRDRYPSVWARISSIAGPRFAGTQTISVTRWRNGSVSRRNYAELVSARVVQCDRAAIDGFLDARITGVDSRQLAARLLEICQSTAPLPETWASAR
ncbi:hypothetical protein [Paraburkholderia dokdonensis]|uniref:hypothetical protein n=1 Tax=Paraburkholderia dokdonensis TaxID=2211211 RepID=UPI00101A1060|nr:hypothetical protein [Paraburkholderia dokdonensis]